MAMTADKRDEMLIEMHGMLCEHAPAIDALKSDLYGNGQIGIKDRVAIIETKQASKKESRMFSVAAVMAIISFVTLVAALAGKI